MRSLHKQRGLSLLWTAVLMALLGMLVIGGLYSMRYGRNPFFDAFDSLVGKSGEAALKKSQEAIDSAKSAATGTAPPPKISGVVRKCTINGQTVYSDVACGADSRKIDIKDSNAGFDKPQAPAKSSAPPPKATDRAIERATQ